MSTSTPHYPSTAELAAFRRTIGTDPRAAARAATAPVGTPNIAPPWAPLAGGAWPTERRDGIGWRDDPNVNGWHTHARREASALRSRTWSSNEWASHPESGGAWWDETHAGLPVHSKCPTGCKLFAGHWGCHPVD